MSVAKVVQMTSGNGMRVERAHLPCRTRRPRPSFARRCHAQAASASASNAAGDVTRAGTGAGAPKVHVELGDYKNKAVSVRAKEVTVSDEEVERLVKEETTKTHELVRVNFTGSGAKMGLHTVLIDIEGRFASGEDKGKPIPGTKKENHQLELTEDLSFPWGVFAKKIVEKGMGQEEQKTFRVVFPEDFKAPSLRGVEADFTIVVHEIAEKKAFESADETNEEAYARLHSDLERRAKKVSEQNALSAIREVLLDTCSVDSKKVVESVAWCKFGEASLRDFEFKMITEEIARAEGIDESKVGAFLVSEANVEWY